MNRLPRAHTVRPPGRRPRLKKALYALGWLVLLAPAIYQLVLIGTALAGRMGYPYDLEWMEGGMLHHALRIHDGHGIYSPPSIEFIPYLYTPLYPAILASLGSVFGLGYTLGRVISVLSLVGIAIVATVSVVAPKFHHVARAPTWVGVALGLGLFAAAYPYMEGWYDLVRADTLFLFLATAGLAACANWADEGERWAGHARVAAAAAILVLGFFCKQTGIFYVALGGVIVLIQRWRRAATFAGIAAFLGLGGTALLNHTTDGWYWIYVRKIHSAHDFNIDRFWKSFGNILWHFPAMTVILAFGVVIVAYTWLRPSRRVVWASVALAAAIGVFIGVFDVPRWIDALVGVAGFLIVAPVWFVSSDGSRRELPRQTWPFLLWTSTFVVSVLVGAVGWGTEFAHFNAYMPAFLHGALAAGAAVPAITACVGILWGARKRPRLVVGGVPAVLAAALGATLVMARWEPAKFIPRPIDVLAGDKLIARLAALPGDVWMPSHPWYLVLAGKQPHVHRMGVKDVTTRQTRTVAGLSESLRAHRFGALVLDDRDLFLEVPEIRQFYHPVMKLPPDERPALYTGAKVVPDSIWVPALPAAPPAGAKVLYDFEMPSWNGWTRSGPAWGDGPVTEPLPGQDLVLDTTGQRFATSMHGGDAAMGRMTSPTFTIDSARITMKLGGGSDATKLRVELWVDGATARTASVPLPGGDALRPVSWDVGDLRDKEATIVLVDDSEQGHLDVDDIWMWSTP